MYDDQTLSDIKNNKSTRPKEITSKHNYENLKKWPNYLEHNIFF